jgi:hypothetical protein
MQTTNNQSLKFDSLEDEQYRIYEFPNGSQVAITNPVALNVSKSGGHRVLDAQGISHYIPAGWYHIYWKVKEGNPAFAF